VSKEAKTGIGLAIVALLALAVYRSMNLLAALAVLVVGAVAVIYVLRRMEEEGDGRPRRKQSTTELLEAATNDLQPLRPWSPPDSLQPWSPQADTTTEPAAPISEFSPTIEDVTPTETAPDRDFWAPTEPAPSDFSDLAPDNGSTTSWLDDPFGKTEDAFGTATDAPHEDSHAPPSDDSWADGSTWDDRKVAADSNPLDELSRLDEVDVIAEFERLETSDTFAEPQVGSPILDELSSPINEAVSTDDDILAASQATELQVTDGENSELAKLLAKVQARLAAYE
jgi:hypothetical protein